MFAISRFSRFNDAMTEVLRFDGKTAESEQAYLKKKEGQPSAAGDKKVAEKPAGNTLLALVDGSPKSVEAFTAAVNALKDQDQLFVVHCVSLWDTAWDAFDPAMFAGMNGRPSTAPAAASEVRSTHCERLSWNWLVVVHCIPGLCSTH
jgi:hypothetical protein